MWVDLFIICRDTCFVLWSALFLPPLGRLAHLAKFANAFWAANLHRRVSRVRQSVVCEERRSSKLIAAMHWLIQPFEFRHTHTQSKGSSVSACKVMCEEMHPEARTFIGGGVGARWHCLQRAGNLRFLLVRHLTLLPLQYESHFSAVPLLVLPFSLFFIIVWSCPFQQQPTGSHSLPNYLHIKQGSPRRRRP